MVLVLVGFMPLHLVLRSMFKGLIFEASSWLSNLSLFFLCRQLECLFELLARSVTGTPCARATASVCSFVSVQAVTRRENSRL